MATRDAQRLAFASAACVLALTACETRPTASAHSGPNVLLITLDTTRADRLSCYGYPKHTSPRLDQLAAEGVLFSHAIAQAAVTPVSHASILTGLEPYHHGLRVLHGRHENRLADSQVTLAEVLREAGYQTAAFVSAFTVVERFGLHQGFEVFDADFLTDEPGRIVSPQGIVNTGLNQRRADATTERALTWLAGAREPFLLWLHYFDPHDPLLRPPAEYLDSAATQPTSPRDQLRALYDAEIRFMDAQIGRVLDELRRSGRYERTLIVAVADHGEGLGDHDWWSHGILYQEQIRVPLIIRGPGLPAGRRVEQLVRTIDIVPTVLELVGPAGADARACGVSAPVRVDGRSLLPLLRGRTATTPLAYADSINMLTYYTASGFREEKDDMLFAITDGTWKYIHHALRPEESELYDLRSDPGELVNLRDQHPQQVERLLAELRARDCFPKAGAGREQMSPEDLRRLRSLGYFP